VFTNSGEILAAAILVAATARWGRRAALLAIPVVPAAFAGWILWAGWPVFGALNVDVGMPVKNLAFVATAAISIASVVALARLRPHLYRMANPHTAVAGSALPATASATTG
jgi:TRAP-type C4-dicarboxylate transport system permease small subunit